jgi:hypothetical protein
MNIAEGRVVERSWFTMALVFGIAALVSYTIVATGALPLWLGRLFFFAFGPFLVLSALALYHVLRSHSSPIWLQAATVFTMIAGALVNLMAVVQQSLFSMMLEEIRQAPDGPGKEAMVQAFRSANTVQLGMDISWDIFVFAGVGFLAVALHSHPRFGQWFTWPGVVIAAAGLVLNLWTFPIPPAEQGLVDVGPAVGLFYAAIVVQLVRRRKWFRQCSEAAALQHNTNDTESSRTR